MPKIRNARRLPQSETELRLIFVLRESGSDDGRPVLLANEAADILGVTRQRLHQMLIDDIVIPAATWGRKHLFYEDDVRKLLKDPNVSFYNTARRREMFERASNMLHGLAASR